MKQPAFNVICIILLFLCLNLQQSNVFHDNSLSTTILHSKSIDKISAGETLSTPVIFSPISKSSYSNILNISWSNAIDSLGYNVEYNLSIQDWANFDLVFNLTHNLNTTWFLLNTTWFPNSDYNLSLTSFTKQGLENTVFVIFSTNNNNAHVISGGNFINPSYMSESLVGNQKISWNLFTDSWGVPVKYNLSLTMYYSPFTKYILLLSSNDTNFNVNLSNYQNNRYYLVLKAYDDYGLYAFNKIEIYINGTLTIPKFTDVKSYKTYNGTLNITWTPAVSTLDNAVQYNLTLAQSNSPFQQFNVIQNSIQTFYLLNTSLMSDNLYQVELQSFDHYGLQNQITINIYFNNSGSLIVQDQIINGGFVVPNPNDPPGKIYSGFVNITWNPFIDLLGYDVYYNLSIYFSYDMVLVSDYTQNFFLLNTTNYPDNETYQLTLISYDLIGNRYRTFDYAYITINNHPQLSRPTFNSLTNNTIYSGLLNVTWTPSFGPLDYSITYNLTMTKIQLPSIQFHFDFIFKTFLLLDTTIYPNGNYSLTLTSILGGFNITNKTVVFIYINNSGSSLELPSFINPINQSIVNGLLNISWTKLTDPFNSPINYNLTLIMQQQPFSYYILTQTSKFNNVIVNTSLYPDGYYLLSLFSYDGYGLSNYISIYLHIDNTGTLTTSVILSPSNGTTYNGMLNVTWKSVINSLGHSVRYNLTLIMQTSPYNYFTIASAYDKTFVFINTSSYPDKHYLLVLLAYTINNLNNSATSSFEINNAGILTKPNIIIPVNESVYSGIQNMTWSRAINSLGYSVRYNITLLMKESPYNYFTLANDYIDDYIEVNTSLYQDGYYSLIIIAFDSHGSTNTVLNNFYIKNNEITSSSFSEISSSHANSTLSQTSPGFDFLSTVLLIGIVTIIEKRRKFL